MKLYFDYRMYELCLWASFSIVHNGMFTEQVGVCGACVCVYLWAWCVHARVCVCVGVNGCGLLLVNMPNDLIDIFPVLPFDILQCDCNATVDKQIYLYLYLQMR